MNPFQKLKRLAAEAAAREQARSSKPEMDNASLLDVMLDNHEKPKPTLAPPMFERPSALPPPPPPPPSFADLYRPFPEQFVREIERKREIERQREITRREREFIRESELREMREMREREIERRRLLARARVFADPFEPVKSDPVVELKLATVVKPPYDFEIVNGAEPVFAEEVRPVGAKPEPETPRGRWVLCPICRKKSCEFSYVVPY